MKIPSRISHTIEFYELAIWGLNCYHRTEELPGSVLIFFWIEFLHCSVSLFIHESLPSAAQSPSRVSQGWYLLVCTQIFICTHSASMNCPSAIPAQYFLHSFKAGARSERSEWINCVFIGFQLALHHICAAGIYAFDSQALWTIKFIAYTM